MLLPNWIFFGGKKKAGKDYCCAAMEEAGYRTVHIARPWLEVFAARRGLTWEQYEATKHLYRAELQREAAENRARDPEVLCRLLRDYLPALGDRICVTGVRFINEARLRSEERRVGKECRS